MIRKSPLSVAISTTLALAATGVSTAAWAQDAELEEVVVTGSRIAREDGFGAVAPVSVVNSDAIKASGYTRMEDVLNSLPSVEAAQNSFISNGATGAATLDLRGLGPDRTLVLFNGRRMQAGGMYNASPDVNQIPSAMVERVEVLTGGASATYGADAVAGVVNFIMRRVNGVEFSVGGSAYYHQNGNDYLRDLMDRREFDYAKGGELDGKSYNFDLVMGSDFADGKGNATAYVTWRQSDALLQGARDYSSCALNAAGTACGGSGTAPIPSFIIAPIVNGETDWDAIDYFQMVEGGALGAWGASGAYNYAPINYFMRPEERWSLGTFADYEINDNFTAYVEANYTGSNTRGQIAESGTFFNTLYDLPVDYFLFPTVFQDSLRAAFPNSDSVSMYIGKRNVEGGPRADLLDSDAYRVVGGLKGAISDNWDYDLYYLYGHTNASSTYINDLLDENVTAAIGEDCESTAGGCYQVFTYNGVTQEQAAALAGTGILKGITSTEVISASVTGDLGFGLFGASNIMMAFGFEHRTESLERISDTVYETGALLGQGGPTPSVKGSYNVTEYYGEANIPLLEDVPFFQRLSLDLAYRWSDYSTSGSDDTYRVGLDWKPIDMLRFRAGFNHAVRAPNVFELFLPANQGLWSGTDPCAGATPEYTEAQCAATGVLPGQYGTIGFSPAGQYNAIYGGNEALEPEAADTITAGVVFEWERLTMSVDYWSIELSDQINNIGSRVILDQCALNGAYCDLINRAPNGSLWLQSGWVVDTNQNFGDLTWEGVDVAARWVFDGLGGTFTTSLIGTYMLTKETVPVPTDKSTAYDCVGLISQKCYPTPEWRHTLSFGYDSNDWWAAGLKWRYFQDVEYDGTVDKIADKYIGNESYLDVNFTWRFNENSDLVLGVNNVLDEEPPMMGNTMSTNANTVAGFWDTLGMFGFANLTFRF